MLRIVQRVVRWKVGGLAVALLHFRCNTLPLDVDTLQVGDREVLDVLLLERLPDEIVVLASARLHCHNLSLFFKGAWI